MLAAPAAFELSDRRLVELPARHRLESAVTAAFLARADAAERLLAERGLPWRAARFLPGRTLLVVACQQFADSPVGPYRQVSVSLPVHARFDRPEPPPPVPLLPLLAQALWRTERVFTDLHFYVAAIPVSEPAAVAYSHEIWGEPAWVAAVTARRGEGSLPGSPGAWWEVSVGHPGGENGETFLRMAVKDGGLPFTERRGYRLVSRRGAACLTDVMRVEAPARLAFGPGRAVLEPGRSPRAAFLPDLAGRRPVAVQALVHGPGTVTFGGPCGSDGPPCGSGGPPGGSGGPPGGGRRP